MINYTGKEIPSPFNYGTQHGPSLLKQMLWTSFVVAINLLKSAGGL